MYICIKLPPGDLNFGLCPLLHSTSTYTCGVTIAPKVCDGTTCHMLSHLLGENKATSQVG